MTNKHRLYRGGHRQANAALYRPSSSACGSTSRPSTTSPPHRPRPLEEGHHPLPEAVPRPQVYQRVMTDHRARRLTPP